MKLVKNFGAMCYYVGRDIPVTVVMEDGEHRKTVTGKLQSLADDGDFAIEIEPGKFIYGWPALYLEVENGN